MNQLLVRLNTDYVKGLSDAEAEKRNLEQGDNKLSERAKAPWWVMLIREMLNPFAVMLWVGAVLCMLAYIMQPSDLSNLYLGAILVFVVVLTGAITY